MKRDTKAGRVVNLAVYKKRDPEPEEIARLLRAVDEGSPVHGLPPYGMKTLKRATTRLANLAGTVQIPGDLAATFEYAVAAIRPPAEREAGLLSATLWRCLHGKRLPPPGGPQKDTHKRVLSSNTYICASVFAHIFCDATARLDAIPEVRDLCARAFKELAALVGVDVPAFAWTPRAWKKARAAYVESMRAVRLLCEAEGLKDIPHHSDLHRLDEYTRAGITAGVAVWLEYTLWAYYVADYYDGEVDSPRMAERLGELRRALEWGALVERYGAEAVRRAVDERERWESHAVRVARAVVPSVGQLLEAQGALDFDTALGRELGDEWRRFIAEGQEAVAKLILPRFRLRHFRASGRAASSVRCVGPYSESAVRTLTAARRAIRT